jgi:hypothetical protein
LDERAVTNLRDIANIEERLGSLGAEANLGMSLGVNIGTYGYQNNGAGTLLQQAMNSSSYQDGPADADDEGDGEAEEDDELDEDDENDNDDEFELNRDEEEEEDEYDTQNEDEDQECDDEEIEEAEAEDIMDARKNDLEKIIRDAQIDNARIRARTAPLRPMEHVE